MALPGYSTPKPMVFCGLYPVDGDDFEDLRESLERLRLNDASITYVPETSGALGFGFRCGFLGLLHMEIVRERLEREFDLALIATAPSVEYRVVRTDGASLVVDNPAGLPVPQEIESIEEPNLKVSIITPKDYTGTLMDLCQTRRGEMVKLEYLSPDRVELHYRIPLAEVVVDFFDQLKSRSQGYASLDYEPADYARANLVKVDILLNGVVADGRREASAKSRCSPELHTLVLPVSRTISSTQTSTTSGLSRWSSANLGRPPLPARTRHKFQSRPEQHF